LTLFDRTTDRVTIQKRLNIVVFSLLAL